LFVWLFEPGTYYVAQAGLELLILLPQEDPVLGLQMCLSSWLAYSISAVSCWQTPWESTDHDSKLCSFSAANSTLMLETAVQ
jgi:hypothetical protein